MVLDLKRSGALALRLIVGLALLGCSRVGAAQGTWSVISLPQQNGEVVESYAVAVDGGGDLYVAEFYAHRIQKRDTQGNWSVIASYGKDLGQVYYPAGLTVDTGGNLYVAEYYNRRIQKQDTQGNWSVIATGDASMGQVAHPSSLGVDAAGNLYIVDVLDPLLGTCRIEKRDALGAWSVIATDGSPIGDVGFWPALTVDPAGNSYVAGQRAGIQKWAARGKWTVIASQGLESGQVSVPTALAVDREGSLYAAEQSVLLPGIAGGSPSRIGVDRIQRRDALGNWSVIATAGADRGQVSGPTGLTVDGAGNLYVADSGNNRVLKYIPGP